MDDSAIFEMIWAGEGAVELSWESATRCDCYSQDTKQPRWDHDQCGGLGVRYAPAQTIRALFRSQSRWTAKRMSGEHGLGEATLTTRIEVKPVFLDDRVKDRFTVINATGDAEQGRVFHPIADPVPFLFGAPPVHRAWRVQIRSLQQQTRG